MLEDKIVLHVRRGEGDVDAVMQQFSQFAATAAIPTGISATMKIVLDELVSNVVKYGYDDDAEHAMEISFRITGAGVEIEIVDDGHPFDMLGMAAPDTSLGINERKIGGLGIHMVKKMTDTQRYERRDGRNRNTIWKRL